MELLGAIRSGDVRRVDAALREGADPNGPASMAAVNPLSVAAERGNLAVVKRLLDAGADPNWKWAWPPALYEAAIEGHAQVVAILLEHGADPDILNEEAETPLMGAAAKGSVEAARMLLDAGANAKKRSRAGTTAIEVAAANKHWDVVSLLKPHSPREAVACADRMFECVNSELDEDEVRRFLDAARSGDTRRVQRMLRRGMPADAASRYGYTALMMAASRGHLELVKLLIQHGADPAARNAFGDSAVVFAVGPETLDTFEYLYATASDRDRKRAEKEIRWRQMLPEQYPQWQGWKPKGKSRGRSKAAVQRRHGTGAKTGE